MLSGAAVLLASTSVASHGQILHFSDTHLNISRPLLSADLLPIRYFADAPLALLESALSYAKNHVVDNPELFLYTGDHVAHGSFTDGYIARAVAMNVETMERYYPLKLGMTKATAIIGNADGSTSI